MCVSTRNIQIKKYLLCLIKTLSAFPLSSNGNLSHSLRTRPSQGRRSFSEWNFIENEISNVKHCVSADRSPNNLLFVSFAFVFISFIVFLVFLQNVFLSTQLNLVYLAHNLALVCKKSSAQVVNVRATGKKV